MIEIKEGWGSLCQELQDNMFIGDWLRGKWVLIRDAPIDRPIFTLGRYSLSADRSVLSIKVDMFILHCRVTHYWISELHEILTGCQRERGGERGGEREGERKIAGRFPVDREMCLKIEQQYSVLSLMSYNIIFLCQNNALERIKAL